MRAGSIGRIIASKNPQLKVGDWATGFPGWAELAVLGPGQVNRAKRFPGTQVADMLGVLREYSC